MLIFETLIKEFIGSAFHITSEQHTCKYVLYSFGFAFAWMVLPIMPPKTFTG